MKNSLESPSGNYKYTAEEKRKIIYKISFMTVALNVLLAVAKVVAGVLGGSRAMISDAAHSVSDVLSTIVVIVSAALFKNASDEAAKKKNAKIEFAFSIVMAAILLFTAGDLIVDSLKALIKGENESEFSFIEIIVSAVSILTKIFIFIFTVKTAKKIDYAPLTANAWHQAADAFTSIATIIGVVSVKLFHSSVVDSIMSLLISLFILHIAIDVIISGIEKLKGKKCSHTHKHNCDKCMPDLKIDENELCKNCKDSSCENNPNHKHDHC